MCSSDLLSWDPIKEASLLEVLLAPKSADPSKWDDFLRRTRWRLTEFRNRQKVKVSSAERKAFWAGIKDQELNKLAQRERDMKRHAKRMRQLQQERERQIRRNKGKL